MLYFATGMSDSVLLNSLHFCSTDHLASLDKSTSPSHDSLGYVIPSENQSFEDGAVIDTDLKKQNKNFNEVEYTYTSHYLKCKKIIIKTEKYFFYVDFSILCLIKHHALRSHH